MKTSATAQESLRTLIQAELKAMGVEGIVISLVCHPYEWHVRIVANSRTFEMGSSPREPLYCWENSGGRVKLIYQPGMITLASERAVVADNLKLNQTKDPAP
jgi:hypothetical protein